MNPLTEPYEYGYGYAILKTHRFMDLPPTINVGGDQLLVKPEFHVSLICTKRIAGIIDKAHKQRIEDEIIEQFRLFVQNKDLTEFKPTKNFRLVERGERKTIVMMVELPGLKEFFESLSERYGKKLPLQPTHITMYTLQPDAGIGILSYKELENDSKPIQIEELANSQFAVESV